MSITQILKLIKEYKMSQSLSYINGMKAIQLTQNEINQATRPNVYRSKKHYTRKSKHKTI
jgi:hypothetical protein